VRSQPSSLTASSIRRFSAADYDRPKARLVAALAALPAERHPD